MFNRNAETVEFLKEAARIVGCVTAIAVISIGVEAGIKRLVG